MNPESIVEDTIKQYGINMRGSGQNIGVVVEDLRVGTLGVTRQADFLNGNPRIVLNRTTLHDESTLANTIAHELSHARDYLRAVLGLGDTSHTVLEHQWTMGACTAQGTRSKHASEGSDER